MPSKKNVKRSLNGSLEPRLGKKHRSETHAAPQFVQSSAESVESEIDSGKPQLPRSILFLDDEPTVAGLFAKMREHRVPDVDAKIEAISSAVKAFPDTEKFGVASRLALLVMSACYHGKTFTESLSDQLKSVESLNDNPAWLQAAIRGTFNIESFCPVASLSIEEIVEKHGSVFDVGVKVLVVSSEPSVLLDRHISMVHLQSVALEVKEAKLNIFTGDSGSGKTTTAIATAMDRKRICVHVTLENDVFGDDALNRQKSCSAGGDNWRNVLVATKLENFLLERGPRASKKSKFGVAVIIDELGGFPLVLRSLCSIYGELTEALKKVYLADHVEIYACGTGCDSNTNRPGSSVAMYNIIDMSSRLHQEAFWQSIFKDLPPSLEKYLKSDSVLVSAADAATVLSVKALLTNRRVGAAFRKAVIDVFRSVPDTSAIHWRHVAPHLANTAVLRFKRLNGLRNYHFGGPLNRLFSLALAHSLGGAQQLMNHLDEGDLIRRCGLVTDNARRMPSDSKEIGTVIQHPDEGSKDVLALPKDVVHRYAVSSAQLEMFRMGFGMSPRPRSGAGFEQTVCDYLMVLLCAESAGIAIADVQNDPLADVKRRIRGACATPPFKLLDVVVSLQLNHRAKTIHERQVTGAVSESLAQNSRGCPTRFAAVLLNGPRAEAADVFVMVGTYNPTAQPPLVITFGLAVQCKHYLVTKLTTVQLGSELYKCGSRCKPACLAEIVKRIKTTTDVAPVVTEVLNDVCSVAKKEQLADLVSNSAFLSDMNACISSRRVQRDDMLKKLLANTSVLKLLKHVKGDCDDAVVICLSKVPLEVDPGVLRMKGFINLTTEATGGSLPACDALYPVALGKHSSLVIQDWSTVSFI
jgi:energy-coupling factor transporter ATP-binding protein EcfA2